MTKEKEYTLEVLKSSFTRSMAEELVGAVWIIVALLSYMTDIKWLMFLSIINAGICIVGACIYGYKDLGDKNPWN